MICTNLKYIEHFLVLASVINRCISISPSLGVPTGITTSQIKPKICVITARIKMYKLIIKKKKKKYDKFVLLAKTKSNIIENLISKDLNDLNISRWEFVLINNVLKEYDDTKEKINNLKTS